MVSTRSRTTKESSPPASAELPQKRAAPTAVDSKRPAKKATMATSDFAVGKAVTKDVTLLNQEEKEIKFADTYRDQGVVFFMYPKANTPGCTKQACGTCERSHLDVMAIKDAGFTVYGLSGDSPKALNSWKTKQNLPFDLLSDPEHKLIAYFGSSLPGSKVQRSHVVILKGGVVGDITSKVSPADSVSRAVTFVKENGVPVATGDEETPEEAALALGDTITFDIELQTDASTSVRFQDLFKERGAIFFMFPKADTPGCTIQSCGFNDNLAEINAAGFDVYGLGGDTPAELLAWKQAQKYKYTFLSDPKHELIGYFGSSINDGTRVERSHVIVLPGGEVGEIEHAVSPKDSVSKSVAFAKSHATSATKGSPPASAELPQKRAAPTTVDSKRPVKKATMATMATSDFARGKAVTKDVTLLNQEEKEVKFADTYRDQGVVFFMYPKANTPGSFIGFRDNVQAIKDAGFTVYGLSGDSPNALGKWKTEQGLPFDLLSDPEHKLIAYFGSSLPDSKIQRSHVVILKGGVVGDIHTKVSPADIVEFVQANSTSRSVPVAFEEEETPEEAALALGDTITFDIELQTDASTSVRFQDLFKERGAIFFMFPKADTPGCTIQSCGFNDNLAEINAAGFDVYGLGGDTPAELLAWKQAQKYKYTFLSDPKHELIGYFGSSINDGTRVERSHVIVLPGGEVGEIERAVSPKDSVSKSVAFAKSHATSATSKL
ncbi:hypothetical protein BBJ28_00022020 [Nothophytophthora sp. Chile5]|nr:hypothetical protein BBJ28_00022020 [Nothophytophthora sp. Chile5]